MTENQFPGFIDLTVITEYEPDDGYGRGLLSAEDVSSGFYVKSSGETFRQKDCILTVLWKAG